MKFPWHRRALGIARLSRRVARRAGLTPAEVDAVTRVALTRFRFGSSAAAALVTVDHVVRQIQETRHD